MMIIVVGDLLINVILWNHYICTYIYLFVTQNQIFLPLRLICSRHLVYLR